MGNTSSRYGSSTRELEKYTKPTGLYPTCPWELKAARRLIMERKIAPRFPGREAKESCFTQECPICFMYYPGNLNVSTCCKKPICSECFLQMKPPKKLICCPFCNQDMFGIKYSAPAVIELSSIYSERSLAPELARPEPPKPTRDDRAVAQHYASVEDRQKLRDDLRSQLNIAVGPITTPPPTSAVAVQDALMYASPADARQLEDLMLMEAIRRSMYDLRVGKDAGAADTRTGSCLHVYESSDDGQSDADARSVSLSQIMVRDDGSELRPSGRRSSNPFDDDFDASSCGESDRLTSPRTSHAPDWNPYGRD